MSGAGSAELAAVPFLLSAAVCLGMALLVRRDLREARGGTVLAALLGVTGVWSLFGAVKYLSDVRAVVETLVRIDPVVSTVAAVVWFWFVSTFVGWRVHTERWFQAAVGGEAVLLLVMGLANPANLFWQRFELSAQAPYVPAVEFGPVFLVNGSVVIGLVVGGAYGLVEHATKSDGTGARASVLVAAAALLPSTAGVEYLLGLGVFPFNYTPLGSGLFAVVIAAALWRGLFDVVPVSREVVFEQMSEGVLVLDGSGRVVDFNPGLVTDLWLSADDIGTPFEESMPTDEIDLVDGEQALLAVGRGDGPEQHVSARVNRIERGSVHLGWVLLFDDVTDLKTSQQELERKNERLEEFASVLSHDLRNPLNAAQGYVDLARADADSEHLDRVARNHERMERMISDVLVWTREESEVEETTPVPLSDLVDDCRTVVEDKGSITVETDLVVAADRDRLRRLVENLVRNAVEHGHTGDDDVVNVTVGRCEGGFYVADDGPGIPKENRDEVFDAGTTTAADGTGLGLSIVAEIAGAHGWDVDVTESASGGARFEIVGVAPDREAVTAD